MALEILLVVLAAVAALTAVGIAVWLAQSSRGALDSAELAVREELRLGRDDAAKAASELRSEVSAQLKGLTDSNELRLERLRSALDTQLKQIQEGNERKLDEMRRTVDEKLQGTLEKRLGEAFKLVSERLEAVHQGLGDMKNLAAGVGDLKRVLSGVKTRGTFGEVQLGAILEQILTPDQYARNVQPKPYSREVVEYAVRLPGSSASGQETVWLPLDAKFPHEDYARLQAAADAGDAAAVSVATDALVRTVRLAAQVIQTKYIAPPHTTDFAVLFLPTEGLYAEVVRQPGLVEALQRDFSVTVAGPTILAALLNSLRMGFRTLAIEQRASEVWKILAAVKAEFGKFGEVLDRVKRQLQTASNTIEDTGARTRAIERTLRGVEALPTADPPERLPLFEGAPADSDEDAT